MPGEYPTIYQKARKTTTLTQEQAAEQLFISVESIKAYEQGQRIPPNPIVAKMAEIYDTAWLAMLHLQSTEGGLGVLPENTGVQSLPTAAIMLINRVLDFAERNRDRQLLRIAEDGQIDEKERPLFEEILEDLTELICAAYQVRYAEGISAGEKEKPHAAAATTAQGGGVIHTK